MSAPEIHMVLETESSEAVSPALDQRTLTSLSPVGETGRISIVLRPSPEYAVASHLPEVQAVVAAVPWAGGAAAAGATARLLAGIAREWIRARAGRRVKIGCPDGRVIELEGVDFTPDDVLRVLELCSKTP